MRKALSPTLRWLLALLFATMAPTGAFASSPAPGIGKIVVKADPVYILRNGKTLKLGVPSINLRHGDEAITGSTGKALILLKNADAVSLSPSSRLKLTQQTVPGVSVKISRFILKLFGKLRARVRKSEETSVEVHTPTSVIGVKGTDFIVEFLKGNTRVGTLEGLVRLQSSVTKGSIDIPPGKMGSVSPAGEVLPLSEFAGELMKDVDFIGEKMDDSDHSGSKMEM